MEPSAEWDTGNGNGVQIYLDPERAGGHTMILGVDDMNATLAELARRGIDGQAYDVPSGRFRLCELNDPSNNTVVLAQTLRGLPPVHLTP